MGGEQPRDTCGVMLARGRCVLKRDHDGLHARKKPRQYNESHDQREVVKWIRARPDWLVMRIENAAKRTAAQAARDKALGMEDGAPDLAVWLHGFRFFVEMKSLTGSVSDKQRRLHAELRKRGEAVLVGFGHEATIKVLEELQRQLSYWHDVPQRDQLLCGVIEQENNRGR